MFDVTRKKAIFGLHLFLRSTTHVVNSIGASCEFGHGNELQVERWVDSQVKTANVEHPSGAVGVAGVTVFMADRVAFEALKRVLRRHIWRRGLNR